MALGSSIQEKCKEKTESTSGGRGGNGEQGLLDYGLRVIKPCLSRQLGGVVRYSWNQVKEQNKVIQSTLSLPKYNGEKKTGGKCENAVDCEPQNRFPKEKFWTVWIYLPTKSRALMLNLVKRRSEANYRISILLVTIVAKVSYEVTYQLFFVVDCFQTVVEDSHICPKAFTIEFPLHTSFFYLISKGSFPFCINDAVFLIISDWFKSCDKKHLYIPHLFSGK